MTLRYSLLGPMVVSNSERVIEVGGLKQRSVLAILLMNANQPVTADHLIDELWQDAAPERALATLQAYISNLRRLLEPNRRARQPSRILKTNGGGYQLDVAPSELDIVEFEQLVGRAVRLDGSDLELKRSLLVDALHLWRGAALADFRYEPFAQSTIAHLDELRVNALEERISTELALGETTSLVGELERLANEHPFRERLWGHLMLALYRSGRQGEALRVFRTLETRMIEELGISPGEELRRLEVDILNQDRRLDLILPPPDSPPPPTDIVGRGHERKLLAEALERSSSGSGSVVIVEGEPGIGKTYLLEAFERDARATGARTAFARCVEVGGTPPFWPWVQIIRRLGVDSFIEASGRYHSVLAHVLPGAQVSTNAPISGPLLHQVAEGLVEAIVKLTAAEPMVLFIDDVYSADPDSMSLLVLLASEIERCRVMIVASHRGADLGVDHPLTQALDALGRLNSSQRLRLDRLDECEVAHLVSSVASRDVDRETIEAINVATDGNALYTVELTRLLDAEGALNPQDAIQVGPRSIREVILRRLGPLTPGDLEAIRTAAVAGRQFRLSVVAEACGLSFDDALTAMERVVATGLVTESERPGDFRFSHLIVANCILHDIGSLRRAQIHNRIAAVLETRHRATTELSIDIARHRLEGVAVAGIDHAVRALTGAIEFAMESGALELAESLALQQHDLVDSRRHPHMHTEEIQSLLYLMRIWTWREGYHSSRVAGAVDRMWELTGLSSGTAEFTANEPIMSADPVLATLQAKVSHRLVSGDVRGAAEVVDIFLDMSARNPDPMVAHGATLNAGVLYAHMGDVSAATATFAESEQILDILDPTGLNGLMLALHHQSGRVTHHIFSAWAHWMAGDATQFLANRDRARAVSDVLDHGFTTAFCGIVDGLIGAMHRSPSMVADSLKWARDRSPSEYDLMLMWRQIQQHYVEGMTSGDPGVSAQHIRSLLTDLRSGGSHVANPLYFGLVAELEFRAQSPERALAAARTGIEETEGGERFWYPELERLTSEALALIGRPDESREARARGRRAAEDLGIVPLTDRMRRRTARA